MKHCMTAGNSIIGKSLFYVILLKFSLCFIITEVREEQYITVEFVRELVNIRDGVMKVPDIYVDEV